MIIKQKRVAKAINEANLANVLRIVDARKSEKFKAIEGIQKIIQGAPDTTKAFFLQNTVFDDPAKSLSVDGTSFNPEIWLGFRDGWDQVPSAAGAFYFSNLRVANRIWELIDSIAATNNAAKNWSVLGEEGALTESKGAVRPTLTWGDLMDNKMETWGDLPIAIDNRNWKEIQVTDYSVTYGVSIDLSNSNPETAVTYTDNAVGMVAGSSDWDNTPIFSKIRPCLFKEGKVVGYLDPNNFSKFEDGTAADITSGASGDVMIEIPKLGLKIATNENTLTVQITDAPEAEGFHYYAHTRTTEGDRDKLYIGAFLGYNASSKLRSLCSKQPTINITIGETRTLAQANGSGYDQIAFYQLTLLQCLFLIKYKNRDSQTALGKGYVSDAGREIGVQTGGTVAKGMDYGETIGLQQMKFMGIEDFWGNLYYWIDGLVSSSNWHALTATNNFNDTGSRYKDNGALGSSDLSGFIKASQGTNELGFIIKQSDGSATTYFADYASFRAGKVPYFGGYWNVGSDAGAFRLIVSYDTSFTSVCNGGRLMYL